MFKNLTLRSTKRALTTSFGSICFGSILIAIIDTIKSLTKAESENDDLEVIIKTLNYCCNYVFSWIKNMVKYFNIYAFKEVVIYGKPYIQAAKNTWTLCKTDEMNALINDCMINTLFLFAYMSIDGLSAMITFITAILMDQNVDTVMIFTIFAVLIGMFIFNIFSQVIKSGITTTFVCLCGDSQALLQTKLELYEKIKNSYPSFKKKKKKKNYNFFKFFNFFFIFFFFF